MPCTLTSPPSGSRTACTYRYLGIRGGGLFLIEIAAYVFFRISQDGRYPSAPENALLIEYLPPAGGRWPVLIDTYFARSAVRDADCENMLIVISDSQNLSTFPRSNPRELFTLCYKYFRSH